MEAIKRRIRNWLFPEGPPKEARPDTITEVFSAEWDNRDSRILQDFLNTESGGKFRALLLNTKAELCQNAAFSNSEDDRKMNAAHAKALDSLLYNLTTLAGGVNSIQESLSSLGVLGAGAMSQEDYQAALDRMATGERYDGADVMGVR